MDKTDSAGHRSPNSGPPRRHYGNASYCHDRLKTGRQERSGEEKGKWREENMNRKERGWEK